MAYDVELADRIRALVPAGTPEKAMFGGLAFLIGGHLSVTASGGAMMVRCDPDETDMLAREDGVAPMVMRGREMPGWLRVEADAVPDDESLARWVEIGTAYARSLPPK